MRVKFQRHTEQLGLQGTEPLKGCLQLQSLKTVPLLCFQISTALSLVPHEVWTAMSLVQILPLPAIHQATFGKSPLIGLALQFKVHCNDLPFGFAERIVESTCMKRDFF